MKTAGDSAGLSFIKDCRKGHVEMLDILKKGRLEDTNGF